MKQAIILRSASTDHGTFSTFVCAQANFTCFVAELPWKNNEPRMSCIPTGEYTVKPVQSPKYGLVFMVYNVENRSAILFHSGNFAGDTTKNLKTHSLGCILPGSRVAKVNGQNAVLLSKNAVYNFQQAMGNEPFKLTIL